MWPLSAQAQNLLAQAHSVDIHATAYTAAFGVISDLQVHGGSIDVDATSQVRRSGTVEFSDLSLWPADPLDILSPLGSELAIHYGIVTSPGVTEWIPLIRGPITEVSRTRPLSGEGSSGLSVSVADRSHKVAENRFEAPAQTVASATVVAEITRLITDAIPTATVIDLTESTQVAAQLELERERWADGIEVLADSIAAEVFADAVGTFYIRPQPTLDDDPVWTVSTGDRGVIVGIDEKQTRELTYNKVVASGQRTDGTPPVWAAVSDDDPTSPTYVGGVFGVKTRFYSSALLTTTPQCTTAAQGLLERTKGMHGSVELSLITNPALDAGDVIVVRDNGTASTHIIDMVSIPLSPADSQRIATRSLDLPEEYG